MLPIRALASFMATITLASASGLINGGINDLGSVLASRKNLTKYIELMEKYPEILMQLPSYDGVTIIAPNDAAFDRIPYTSLHGVWDPENREKTVPLIQYMILQGTVSTQAIKSGPTYIKPTILTNMNYTNVTTGQNIAMVKQPEDLVVFMSSMGTRTDVVEKDIRFRGGLIQVVDNLLVPPARLRDTAQSFKVNSFLGGLYAAGLMPDLADQQNVTIFAPKDSIMEAVGGSLENLDAKALRRIMGYHVIPGKVLVSSDLKNGTILPTMARDELNKTQNVVIQQVYNNMYVNTAQIVQPDILIANGIMHIVAGVMNPNVVAPQPDPDRGVQAPVFVESTADDVVFTTAIPCTVNCPVPTETMEVVTTSYHRTRTSKAEAPAKATAHIAGAALGMMGLGAGMAWL